MQRAINAGCRIIYGKEMLINQALKQFYLFTGMQFPCKNEIALLIELSLNYHRIQYDEY